MHNRNYIFNEPLKTKFIPVKLRKNIVPRPRLIEKLNQGLANGHKFTLISAPAGSGKTTLAALWIKQLRQSSVWLSLDRDDNDLNRFWLHVVTALHEMDRKIGRLVLPDLKALDRDIPETLLISLVNDIFHSPLSSVLILDDYHVIQTKEIHDSMNFFLEHLSPNIHIAIISREDPPLFLSHKRGAMFLSEIRFSDLRLNREEIEKLFNHGFNIKLSGDDVNALAKRTDGWIVGLQMAALSLKNLSAEHKQNFIKDFTGNNRYIMDYLIEVVFNNQDKPTQTFLLKTSILERLSSSLCDAVTGGSNSQPILEMLERNNLFIISLDNKREWYRYHHLFADILKHRLNQSLEKEEISRLYLEASQWYEKNGLVSKAVSYALQSGNYDFAAQLIEKNVLKLFYLSQTRLIHNWLKAIPAHVLCHYPLLSAVFACCMMLSFYFNKNDPREKESIDTWLKEAEKQLADKNRLKKESDTLARHYIAKVRAYLAQLERQDPHIIIRMSQEALRLLPENELRFRSAHWHNLGNCYFRLKDYKTAINAFQKAKEIGQKTNDLFNASSSVHNISKIYFVNGNLLKAREICDQGLAELNRLSGKRPVPYSGRIFIIRGMILSELCRFKEAELSLNKGYELLDLTRAETDQQLALIQISYLKLFQGKKKESFSLIHKAQKLLPQYAYRAKTHRIRLYLLSEEPEEQYYGNVLNWLESKISDTSLIGDNDLFHLTRIRVIINHSLKTSQDYRLIEIADFLEKRIESAERDRLAMDEIEAYILLSQVQDLLHEKNKSEYCLKKALELGEKKGFLFSFLNEPAYYINRFRKADFPSVSKMYVNRLISIYDKHKYKHKKYLSEPLSPREMEILALIYEGTTNPEISKKLFISIHTVKTHVNHIFAKLDVSTRTQAVVRARNLNLLKK